MGSINVMFKSNVGSSAVFEGVVEPKGPTGYTFSGTLKAVCKLDRSSTDFKNTVHLGHGGTSAEYTYQEFVITGVDENVFKVSGEGSRKKNETVDFRVGVNDGLSGQFHDGDKASVTVGGPAQRLTPTYISKDSLGNSMYDVRFDGSAWADGPTGYVIRGTLNAHSGPGAATTQYATFGYRNAGGSWQYKTFACDDTPTDFTIHGQRSSGEKIAVVVGATSKVLNLYGYSDEVSCSLPTEF